MKHSAQHNYIAHGAAMSYASQFWAPALVNLLDSVNVLICPMCPTRLWWKGRLMEVQARLQEQEVLHHHTVKLCSGIEMIWLTGVATFPTGRREALGFDGDGRLAIGQELRGAVAAVVLLVLDGLGFRRPALEVDPGILLGAGLGVLDLGLETRETQRRPRRPASPLAGSILRQSGYKSKPRQESQGRRPSPGRPADSPSN